MLLASHFLSGLAICWLPLIIACAASALFADQSHIISSGYIISQFGLMLLQTALIFSIFVAAGIVASSTPMHIISCIAFTALPSALGLLADDLCSRFLFGYFTTESVENFITISAVPIYFSIVAGEPGFPVVIGYIAATLALFAGAMALYKKRPLEKAGDTVAFGFMEVGFCFFSSFVGGYIFANLFETLYNGQDAYFYAGMAIGGFASFFVARMIVKKTLRVWNKASFKQFGIFAAIALLLLADLKTDAYGFERRVPKASKVKSVTVNLSYVLRESAVNILKSEYVFKDKDAIDAVISMHDMLVANRDELRESSHYEYFAIDYDLPSGGRLSRTWQVDLEVIKNDYGLAALLDTDEFKAQNRLRNFELKSQS
jgi:ABC-2 type transport system permease protein